MVATSRDQENGEVIQDQLREIITVKDNEKHRLQRTEHLESVSIAKMSFYFRPRNKRDAGRPERRGYNQTENLGTNTSTNILGTADGRQWLR